MNNQQAYSVMNQVGMTMRQWYKGQALADLASVLDEQDGNFYPGDIVEQCARPADAMIKEDKVHAEKTV